MSQNADTVAAMLAELKHLAEIAAAILDGDEVARIITDQAMYYIAHPNEDHPDLAGDYFDVDQTLFLRTKKLLLRIARLSKLNIGVTVLVRVPDTPWLTVALHNGTNFRYYRQFGQLRMAAPAEISEVFATGRILSVGPDDSMALATALGPIRDSLGDVIGVVELTTATDGQTSAWN